MCKSLVQKSEPGVTVEQKRDCVVGAVMPMSYLCAVEGGERSQDGFHSGICLFKLQMEGAYLVQVLCKAIS